MNYNYTACCWFPTSSNILILPSQFWQIKFESYWLRCSKCRILVFFTVYSKSREDAFHFRKRQVALSHCHKRALFHIFSWVLHAMNYKRIGMPHGALGLYMFDFFIYVCVCMSVSVSLYLCVYVSVYSVVHCTGIDRIDILNKICTVLCSRIATQKYKKV